MGRNISGPNRSTSSIRRTASDIPGARFSNKDTSRHAFFTLCMGDGGCVGVSDGGGDVEEGEMGRVIKHEKNLQNKGKNEVQIQYSPFIFQEILNGIVD